MKKTLILLILLLLAIVLAIYVNTNIIPDTSANKKANTYEIRLESNSSTGYQWSYTMDKTGIVKESKTSYIPDNTSSAPVPGSGGTSVYTFESIAQGEVILTFTYQRSWETDVEPIKSVTYHLSVDKDLKISEIKLID